MIQLLARWPWIFPRERQLPPDGDEFKQEMKALGCRSTIAREFAFVSHREEGSLMHAIAEVAVGHAFARNLGTRDPAANKRGRREWWIYTLSVFAR